jgi:hypothetical protein
MGLSQSEMGLSARKTGLSERDMALSARETGLSERDMALSTRKTGLSERDMALSARETGLSERDMGLSTRKTGLSERDTGLSARETGLSAMPASSRLAPRRFSRSGAGLSLSRTRPKLTRARQRRKDARPWPARAPSWLTRARGAARTRTVSIGARILWLTRAPERREDRGFLHPGARQRREDGASCDARVSSRLTGTAWPPGHDLVVGASSARHATKEWSRSFSGARSGDSPDVRSGNGSRRTGRRAGALSPFVRLHCRATWTTRSKRDPSKAHGGPRRAGRHATHSPRRAGLRALARVFDPAQKEDATVLGVTDEEEERAA